MIVGGVSRVGELADNLCAHLSRNYYCRQIDRSADNLRGYGPPEKKERAGAIAKDLNSKNTNACVEIMDKKYPREIER